jgi:type I restriction enzyme R subunit
MLGRYSESAFETVIEAHLLANGYVSVPREGFDRERAIFPEKVLSFIRETQPAEWAAPASVHGAPLPSVALLEGRHTIVVTVPAMQDIDGVKAIL